MTPALANRTNWVPARIRWQGCAGIVEWCWLGDLRFTDPFFDDTIERARGLPFNDLFAHTTPIEELGASCRETPGLKPSGFIFHMSRCGSTLVSRMLASLPDTVVISEAAPIDWLARAGLRRPPLPEPLQAEWLRWAANSLGRTRLGTETRYFIKFDSLTTLALPFIRRVFPDTPWIFLHRDPAEVLVSQLRETAAAMSPGILTDAPALDLPLEEIVAMSPTEYAARVIGRICQCARNGMDRRGLAIAYSQLPEPAIDNLARHFDLNLTNQDRNRMLSVARFDAKHPRRAFEPDSAGKHREVTAAMREAAARWIAPFMPPNEGQTP